MKTDPTSPRQYVSSGHYVVSESKKRSLEALLGSCVGVTLCDKASRVGGLIHLLLPEPTGLDKPWKAGIYATTGLPLFVQALCDAGARKSRLEACVAGGALVGPVSRQDLDLERQRSFEHS
jgi:chemotaxis receptor (MCP) glutamine deamidase CheD